MIVAVRDRAVIKKDEGSDLTPGGIAIPEVCKDSPQIGEVMDVGPGIINHQGVFIPTTLKKGDRVVFAKHEGIHVWDRGQKYFLMRETDILAVLESYISEI